MENPPQLLDGWMNQARKKRMEIGRLILRVTRTKDNNTRRNSFDVACKNKID